MSEFISVPIHRSVYNEFIIRTGKDVDVANWIQNIVLDFLERNEEGHPEWCDAYYDKREIDRYRQKRKKYGDLTKGYMWRNVFLSNGTELKMHYKGKDYYARVKNEKIYYKDISYSPSEFARHIANNTSRNAWRDIWIRDDTSDSINWELADTVRKMEIESTKSFNELFNERS